MRAKHDKQAAQQSVAADRLQLRSFLTSLTAAAELGRCAIARRHEYSHSEKSINFSPMDATDYKTRCSQPNVMSRHQIESSAQVLAHSHSHLSGQLRALVLSEPICKPELHQGGTHSDYFVVNVSQQFAEDVAEALLDAEADAVSPEGETTAKASFIADLVDAWNQYLVAVHNIYDEE
jgi:hypothetical protein